MDIVILFTTVWVVVTLTSNVQHASASSIINVQAEAMTGVGKERIIDRAGASGQKAVHLNTGEKLQFEMCVMPTTALGLSSLVYSHDGGMDRILVELDQVELASFSTTVWPQGGSPGWNTFVSAMYMNNFKDTVVPAGSHLLTLTIQEADAQGIEIDYITLSFNTSQTLESVGCHLFCFDDAFYHKTTPPHGLTPATAKQHSDNTACAEEDNVNIPVYHNSATNFEVSASLPKYRSFLNNKGADWTNCQLVKAFWNFTDIDPRQHNVTYFSETAQMKLNFQQHGGFIMNSNVLGSIEISFNLSGPSTGHTDSEIGTSVHLKKVQFNGTILFKFEYFDRYNKWSVSQSETVSGARDNITFSTPDFSFREGSGNLIRISLLSDQGNVQSLSIGDMYMEKRTLKADASRKLYEDGMTVIEAVDIDVWWRINETMNVTVTDNGVSQTFTDADYIRFYQRVPWSENDFSQVFVMYQDGNIRLLPVTPHGLDWIPFGSSVIIGQTDPGGIRPSAPISKVYIDPHSLNLTIFYTDGAVISVQVVPSFVETKLIVSVFTYARDLLMYPFFTFRSMFVSDGNSDVDNIAVDGGQSHGITDQWGSLHGHYFAFFRKCISKHNTLSPDITLNVLQ